MFTFLRKIRLQLLTENKTGRYLKYAIGEILLVVIGILLALQINTWNEDRKSSAREMKLLAELRTNLQINVQNLENDIESQVKSAATIDYLIEHLANRRPYKDSLKYYFYDADYAPDVVLSASAFETLKSAGLELIKTDSLRSAIINLFEIDYPTLMQETRRLEDQVWAVTIVPLLQRHFRIENIDQYVVNDYKALLDDKEFTNMLSFRGNLRKGSTVQKMKAVDQTLEVLSLIVKELENK
jgi:hypothetical protein